MMKSRAALLAALMMGATSSMGTIQITGSSVDKAIHQLAPAKQRRKSQRLAGGSLNWGSLVANRAGKPGTVAQDKRRSTKARNRAANRAAHR